jgi:glycosyltransferase involved in cell wall biosynthesis
MKKIAIIAPCILPVPATLGGAVEGLITRIIEDNEREKNYEIDLFTIPQTGDDCFDFSLTNVINVRPAGYTQAFDRVSDKLRRMFSAESSTRRLDKLITGCFSDRLKETGGNYDAVIIENMMSTACAVVDLCNGRYDFPIYFHMHNDVDMYRSPEHIRKLVRFGVRFISVSEYIKGQILKCDKNAVVTTLYNGVDLSGFNRAERKQNRRVTLLYAGRIIPGKGVKELVLSFINMLNQIDEAKRNSIRLLIVGFSGFDRGYEAQVRTLAGRHDNIECLAQVGAKEMSSVYDSADIVIMPTINEEPFGLVALETMAKGIPLITTNSGALPEVVGDGAVIVDTSEEFVRKLTNSIMALAFDEAGRQRLSESAYERAHGIKEFDIQNYYNGFSNIIDAQKISLDDVISVIVPVYNVSDYLKRCVLSITSQTYRNLEIILIDDGSIDDSGAICDELSQMDNRIKVVHQANRGLSGARNTGLETATGKFIFFCDSDDYLRPEALELMLNKLKKDHADIVACGISKVFDKSEADHEKTERFTAIHPGRWGGRESTIQMMRSNNVCTVAWNKLYKRDLFEGIRFPLGIKNEDEATIYKLLYKARIASYIPDDLYMYYQREASIMHDDLENRYQDLLDALQKRIDFFREAKDVELEQHSRITLLEWIKYVYRNIDSKEKKRKLRGVYKQNINVNNAPSVMGSKKKLALLSWKMISY